MTIGAHSAHQTGRIGPNVLIQTAAALERRLGRDAANRALWASARLTVDTLPTEMVRETDANALMRYLMAEFGQSIARNILREAGECTGDYLLAHRIPGIARMTLPLLPGPAALRVLLGAIGRHTWTFAGSARVRLTPGDPAMISLTHCPLCAGVQSEVPTCDFYLGTFARLARALLGRQAWAEEVACEARGDSACRFLIGTARQRMTLPLAKSNIVTRRNR